MERPKKLSGEQGKYIKYLEEKLNKFSSKKTLIKSYIGIKTLVDETNNILINGMTLVDDEGNEFRSKITDTHSLSDKDDKAFDKLKTIIKELPSFNKQLKEWEEEISPEDISDEEEKNYSNELQEIIDKSK